MSILKRISAYTLVSIVTGGISFLILPVITKYLSPSDYGILSIFNASIRFLVALISLGTANVLMIKIIQERKQFGSYFKSFLTLSFGTSIGISFFLFLFLFFSNRSFFGLPYELTLVLPFLAFVILWNETITSILVFLKQIKAYSYYTLSRFGIEILLTILLVVFIPLTWKGRISALIFSILLLSFYAIKLLHRFKLCNGKTNKHNIRFLIRKGLPLIFLNLSITIINLSDRYFIEAFEGINATGIYGIASTVSGILLMVIGAAMNVFRPMLYEQLEQITLFKKQFWKILSGYGIVIISAAVVLFTISPYVFRYWINANYATAQSLILPLIVGLVLWGGYNFLVSILMHFHKMRIVGSISIIGIVCNIVCNYFLIQQLGNIGAAYATLISYFVILCLVILIIAIYWKNDFKQTI